MAACTPQGAKLLNGFRRRNRFDSGLGALLPAAYLKFWKEWKRTKPAAVHYIPKEGKWERDEVTGRVRPIQDIPIPLIFPRESNDGIWGGEAVIQGHQKRHPTKRRVPHFWVPILQRSVVRSDILDEYMSVTVTERTIELIHDNHGFDHYILKTPACELRSTLALRIKRKLLQALESGCPELANNPQNQAEILKEYSRYIEQYTAEEIDWYGLTYAEAVSKIQQKIAAENPIIPQKIEFRKRLIEELKEAGIREAGGKADGEELPANQLGESSWLSKINPFAKKQET